MEGEVGELGNCGLDALDDGLQVFDILMVEGAFQELLLNEVGKFEQSQQPAVLLFVPFARVGG